MLSRNISRRVVGCRCFFSKSRNWLIKQKLMEVMKQRNPPTGLPAMYGRRCLPRW
jgi:hypothetical protein